MQNPECGHTSEQLQPWKVTRVGTLPGTMCPDEAALTVCQTMRSSHHCAWHGSCKSLSAVGNSLFVMSPYRHVHH